MQLPAKTTSDFEQLGETNPQPHKNEGQDKEKPGFDSSNAYVAPEAVFVSRITHPIPSHPP